MHQEDGKQCDTAGFNKCFGIPELRRLTHKKTWVVTSAVLLA